MSRRISLRVSLMVLCLGLCGGLERPQATEAELEDQIRLQRKEARDQLHERFSRIVEVAYKLKRDAAPLCGEEVSPLLGAAIARSMDFITNPWLAGRLPGRIDEIEEATGVTLAVRVISVVETSPAHRAGLEVGDLVRGVGGTSIHKTTDVFNRLRRSRDAALALQVLRGDAEFDLQLPRIEGCNQGVLAFVSTSADTVPHANRHEIGVPTGLVRFARDDDELAIAIAHQLAHQVLGTPRPKHGRDEPPADRLGLFMVARAGFDVTKAPAFWDRLAAYEPWKIHPKATWGRGFRLWHTGMALRAPVIRSSVAEIEALLAAGEPLEP